MAEILGMSGFSEPVRACLRRAGLLFCFITGDGFPRRCRVFACNIMVVRGGFLGAGLGWVILRAALRMRSVNIGR